MECSSNSDYRQSWSQILIWGIIFNNVIDEINILVLKKYIETVVAQR